MEEREGSPEAPATPLGLVRWITWAQRKGGDDWVRSRDLSSEQAFVLGWLVSAPGAIQRDVAAVTRTSAASVSSLLQGLERRGLVERRAEAGDDRRKRVYATPEGAELVSGFAEAMAEVEDRILAPLDDDERHQLLTLLTKVSSQLPPLSR
jgi:MarR family transcriptional repressor of mepA